MNKKQKRFKEKVLRETKEQEIRSNRLLDKRNEIYDKLKKSTTPKEDVFFKSEVERAIIIAIKETEKREREKIIKELKKMPRYKQSNGKLGFMFSFQDYLELKKKILEKKKNE